MTKRQFTNQKRNKNKQTQKCFAWSFVNLSKIYLFVDAKATDEYPQNKTHV